jgi:hypothetical protein
MEPKQNRAAECFTAPADQLSYRWVPARMAYHAALSGALEHLRKGHSLLSRGQFADALNTRALEVLLLPESCAALVEWAYTEVGRTMNIITMQGDYKHAGTVYDALERACLDNGGNMMISVGRPGYSNFMRERGYEITKAIIMKKVFT